MKTTYITASQSTITKTATTKRFITSQSKPRSSQDTCDRRLAIGLISSSIYGMLFMSAPQDVDALVLPFQESVGGLGRNTGGRGSLPASTTAASSSAYGMEGIKKQGITLKERKAILAKTREDALKLSRS